MSKNLIGNIWDKEWNNKDIDYFADIEKSKDKWTLHHLPIIERYLQKVPSEGTFIEAGCGMGQWCFYANKKYGLNSVGIDIAEDTLKRLNAYINENNKKNIVFKYDDLTKSEIEKEQSDFFVSLGVIEHFKDSNPLVKSMYNFSKKGGYGLITVPNIYSFHTFLRPLAKMMGRWTIGLERSFSPKYLKTLCEKNGFEVIEHGVLPSGEIFGHMLNSFPIIGRLMEKVSFYIEKKQNTFGFISYVIVKK